MVAKIQFSRGIDEDAIPDVRLTRSRDGSQGTATFFFQNPKALADDSTEE
ncbi:MAG: photosystem II reaction center protein Psb28, partial [Planktothrix sp.]